MASPAVHDDSDDGMDEFYDKFKTQRYKNAFNENNWEQVSSHSLSTWVNCVDLNFVKLLFLTYSGVR